MAFRSLGVSIFVVMFFVIWGLGESLNNEMAADGNAKIFHTVSNNPSYDNKTLYNLAAATSQDETDERVRNAFDVAPEEQDGGDNNIITTIDMITTVLKNSTTGFRMFWMSFFNLQEGTSAAYLIWIIYIYVNINHIMIMAQLIPTFSFGGNA